MTDSSYTSLPQLPEFRIPVYASATVSTQARLLARRFERAYTYLTNLLGIRLEVRLALLSQQDWPRYVQLPYGLVIYDHTERTVVSGAERTSFWATLLARLEMKAPTLLERLRVVYTAPDGSIDITPHVELWLIHDLGHACHLHHAYWFPRKWLMELFATLCLYTYIAEEEPDLLARAETFLLVLHRLPAQMVEYRTLAEFEARYITLPLDNYLWFSGHLMQLARDLYTQFDSTALTRMWQLFVLGKMGDVTDEELTQQLFHADPALAAMLTRFPATLASQGTAGE